jgi:hypothetical protein
VSLNEMQILLYKSIDADKVQVSYGGGLILLNKNNYIHVL